MYQNTTADYISQPSQPTPSRTRICHRSPRNPNKPIAALPLTTLLVTPFRASSPNASLPTTPPVISSGRRGNAGVLTSSCVFVGLADPRVGEEEGSTAGITGSRTLDNRDEAKFVFEGRQGKGSRWCSFAAECSSGLCLPASLVGVEVGDNDDSGDEGCGVSSFPSVLDCEVVADTRSWENGVFIWFVSTLNWARRRRRRSVSACCSMQIQHVSQSSIYLMTDIIRRWI